jgi:hypothetical protein
MKNGTNLFGLTIILVWNFDDFAAGPRCQGRHQRVTAGLKNSLGLSSGVNRSPMSIDFAVAGTLAPEEEPVASAGNAWSFRGRA